MSETLTPQRRTALLSICAALLLVTLKLVTGFATGSLGLISEAIHSISDLLAAILTFMAVSVSARPADDDHPYGHGKVEHLTALVEGAILIAASIFIAVEAADQLMGSDNHTVKATWYAFAVLATVIAIDASRAIATHRASKQYRSAALGANALHFVSDLAGSSAVLVGLILVSAGYPEADAVAALFVAVLVLIAAFRLMRRNVDALVDREPADARDLAEQAVLDLSPQVELRGLRIRLASERYFVEVTVAVPPADAIGQAHATADLVEEAIKANLPGSEVTVRVEPQSGEELELRERVLAAAQQVAGIREIHNVSLLNLNGGYEAALHIKLGGSTELGKAAVLADRVKERVSSELEQIQTVHVHLEPLENVLISGKARKSDDRSVAEKIEQTVLAATGVVPGSLHVVETDSGLLAFIVLPLDPNTAITEAHELAGIARSAVRTQTDAVDAFVELAPNLR